MLHYCTVRTRNVKNMKLPRFLKKQKESNNQNNVDTRKKIYRYDDAGFPTSLIYFSKSHHLPNAIPMDTKTIPQNITAIIIFIGFIMT